MELTKKQINETKGIAILLMLLLHLFCTKDYLNLFNPIIYIGKYPLIYYLALFGDCCVAIYCFCSGYGLMHSYINNIKNYDIQNKKRIYGLYRKYWIIIFIFVICMGTLINGNNYIKTNGNFFLTMTGISPGYNGAWWFFTTYLILIVFSKKINKIIMEKTWTKVLLISLIYYILGYIQRIKVPIVLDSSYGNYILRQLSLLGTSQLPFVIGGIFQKNKIYSKVYNYFHKFKFKNIFIYLILIGLVVIHGFIETLFIGAFLGIIFIVIFNLIDKNEKIKSFFQYMGDHSTNLWLIHMFIYMIFLKKLVYSLKYPPFIFIWLIILCLPFSYLINYLDKIILKYFNKLKNTEGENVTRAE